MTEDGSAQARPGVMLRRAGPPLAVLIAMAVLAQVPVSVGLWVASADAHSVDAASAVLALVLLGLLASVLVQIGRLLSRMTVDPAVLSVAREALLGKPRRGAYARATVLAAMWLAAGALTGADMSGCAQIAIALFIVGLWGVKPPARLALALAGAIQTATATRPATQ